MKFIFFFFNDTATTEIYTLSLHDALPICRPRWRRRRGRGRSGRLPGRRSGRSEEHTSELQSQSNLVCRLLLEKKKNRNNTFSDIQHTQITNTSVTSICVITHRSHILQLSH